MKLVVKVELDRSVDVSTDTASDGVLKVVFKADKSV